MVISQKAVDNNDCREKIGFLLNSLSVVPKDITIYILAFIHRSIVNERSDFAPEHNERLEFLGDAVLELIITHKLFSDYPNMQEGELTDMRSALVRGRNLSGVAKNLGFQDYLYLGKGEEKSGGRENDYILANTVESFIGALYIDLGFEKARDFILTNIYTTLPIILENKLFKDFKTLLQELTQAEKDITPHYEVISESGPDHDKKFVVGVYLKKDKIGKGEGTSKKKAQESSAENAYLQLTT